MPTPEKILVLSTNKKDYAPTTDTAEPARARNDSIATMNTTSKTDTADQIQGDDSGSVPNNLPTGNSKSKLSPVHSSIPPPQDTPKESDLEKQMLVLQLSRVPLDNYETKLVLDDPNWREYLNSLLPLGLNVLVNSHCHRSAPHRW